MLRGRAAAAAGSLILVGTAAPSALADGGTGAGKCYDKRFCVRVDIPAQPGGEDAKTKPPKSGNGDSSPGESTPDRCAIRLMEPQPPAGSTLWDGHSPDDGAIYINPCHQNGGPKGTVTEEIEGAAFWSQTPPATAVDPAVLAQRAVDSMLLAGPTIASPRAEGRYTVGVPMWLWVTPSPTTWGPNQASASAGGITVTATAKVSSITWSMGDGSRVTCSGPGTAYTADRGMSPSPDCGHRYRNASAGQPGSTYKGTATTTWAIDWAGGGQSGQLTEVRDTPFTVSVGELQVVGQ
ncbi:ATP/GTP-binding protein [Streptomyces goshikiensis]